MTSYRVGIRVLTSYWVDGVLRSLGNESTAHCKHAWGSRGPPERAREAPNFMPLECLLGLGHLTRGLEDIGPKDYRYYSQAWLRYLMPCSYIIRRVGAQL